MWSFSKMDPSGKIVYKLLTEDRVNSALKVQQRSMCDENVAVGVGVYEEKNAAESMECVFREVIKDNCTIVGVDIETDDVVAVSFNKLHVKSQEDESNFFEEVENRIKSPSALALIQFLDQVESRVDIFEKYKISAAMEVFYIGTHPDYRGRQIGKEILGASIELATGLKNMEGGSGIRPEAVFGVFTSNYSQKLAERHNFEWLSEVSYSDFEYFGKKMSDRISNSEHKTSKLGARLL